MPGVSRAVSDLLATVPAIGIGCFQTRGTVAGEQIAVLALMESLTAFFVLGWLVLVAQRVSLSTVAVFICLSLKITSKIISLNHVFGEGHTSVF